jgi:hypothetical protein
MDDDSAKVLVEMCGYAGSKDVTLIGGRYNCGKKLSRLDVFYTRKRKSGKPPAARGRADPLPGVSRLRVMHRRPHLVRHRVFYLVSFEVSNQHDVSCFHASRNHQLSGVVEPVVVKDRIFSEAG